MKVVYNATIKGKLSSLHITIPYERFVMQKRKGVLDTDNDLTHNIFGGIIRMIREYSDNPRSGVKVDPLLLVKIEEALNNLELSYDTEYDIKISTKPITLDYVNAYKHNVNKHQIVFKLVNEFIYNFLIDNETEDDMVARCVKYVLEGRESLDPGFVKGVINDSLKYNSI